MGSILLVSSCFKLKTGNLVNTLFARLVESRMGGLLAEHKDQKQGATARLATILEQKCKITICSYEKEFHDIY